MKILVTGGQGKVGRFVVQELVNSADEVTVFDRVPGPERGAVRYLVGDIQDLGQVMEAMHGADAVIHLAAIHKPNIATATVTYQTNVVGTFNVHHAAFRLGIKRVVSASSNAVVGWSYSDNFVPDYLPVDEDHPLRPEDPYGLSKEIGETIARSYALKGLETISLRPSGVVTPEELDVIKKNRRSQTVRLSSLQLHRRPRSRIGISLGGCAPAARGDCDVCRCRGQHHRRTPLRTLSPH
jgi:nucleoside-diphosphate-sugar epimerase